MPVKSSLTRKYDAYNMIGIILYGEAMATDIKFSKKEASHTRILDAAARAIRRTGYAGASVAEVMKGAGLTHGGFYAHFDSRNEMVASAISYAGQQNEEGLRHNMEALQAKGATPFQALIESYLSTRHMEAAETGCVVAALGSELARQPDPVRQAFGQRVHALIRLVASALPAEVGEAEAAHVTSAMVGAVQLARTLGGTKGKALLAANREILLTRYKQTSRPH